jgi:hypothetical protein
MAAEIMPHGILSRDIVFYLITIFHELYYVLFMEEDIYLHW